MTDVSDRRCFSKGETEDRSEELHLKLRPQARGDLPGTRAWHPCAPHPADAGAAEAGGTPFSVRPPGEDLPRARPARGGAPTPAPAPHHPTLPGSAPVALRRERGASAARRGRGQVRPRGEGARSVSGPRAWAASGRGKDRGGGGGGAGPPGSRPSARHRPPRLPAFSCRGRAVRSAGWRCAPLGGKSRRRRLLRAPLPPTLLSLPASRVGKNSCSSPWAAPPRRWVPVPEPSYLSPELQGAQYAVPLRRRPPPPQPGRSALQPGTPAEASQSRTSAVTLVPPVLLLFSKQAAVLVMLYLLPMPNSAGGQEDSEGSCKESSRES
nr:basic proline-rich protein-like [Equus asinus]